MSRNPSKFQKTIDVVGVPRQERYLSPTNTGAIDEHVKMRTRSMPASIFFYTESDTTIMIDAG